MRDEQYGLYEAIVAATNSEVILFFIIVAVVMAVVVAPLYIAILKDRKAARLHDREREKVIIDVITGSSKAIVENSAVISSLKATLDNHNNNFVKALDRIHFRIDEQTIETRELLSKVNKILIIASGGKLPPEQ